MGAPFYAAKQKGDKDMYTVNITYEDFDGEERTKDLYFHLTEAEITLLNLASYGKYSKMNDKNIQEDVPASIELFQKLIEKAYGQKLDDGTFIKDENAKKAFLCSPEYSALLMKFINQEINIGEFILGCLRKKVSGKIKLNEDGTVTIKE